jgi:hypothetical protein
MQALLLFAAALIAAELLHRRDRDLGIDAESDGFSVSAGIAAAAAVVLGPLPSLLVSTVCVASVGVLRRDGRRETASRTLSLGAAAFVGGYAYVLAGSETGTIMLPDDLLGLAVLGIGFAAVKTLVVRLPARATSFAPDPLRATAEVAVGGAIAIASTANVWNAALLVPLLLLVEHLHGRTIELRREIATALETFANLVDERDPSTYRHSQRVAESVIALAEALGLPKGEARRLWWAGRLHDLGKVAVDASVLRKPASLSASEWEAVTRAPRLSARLLQRFRFTSQQAKAVEYHRERFDGRGYYGAYDADIPLAAHFLIVADAFDAMISERPFRSPLSREDALAEIENNAGTQFHPVIARAFAAVQRGQSPSDVLTAEELATIRGVPAAAARRNPPPSALRARAENVVVGGVVLTLVGIGVELVELAILGAAVALAAAAFSMLSRLRAARLARALDHALDQAADRDALFSRLARAFADAWAQEFALLVAWNDDGSGGTIELAHGATGVPAVQLTSWLLRHAESDHGLILDDGSELDRPGSAFALPLRRESSALVGFLVLGGSHNVPSHVIAAARARVDRIGLALADSPLPAPRPRKVTLVGR